MNQRTNNIVYGILLILIVILLGVVGHYRTKLDKIHPKNDTVTIVHTDTVFNTIIKTVEKPILRRVETIKHDTLHITKDSIITLPVERKLYEDTLTFDVDTVIVESSIVGINPSLESLKAKLKRREISQTTEKIITKYKEKKGFYIVPNASIGYGIFSKQADVYVGVGIGYRF